jgi:beta-N-acetylhexosaminidase
MSSPTPTVSVTGSQVAGTLMPGFEGPALPEWVAARLRAGMAGVCLFGTNIVSREQLAELTASIRAANPQAIIAIDEEGGDVTRLYYDIGSPYPGNAVLGRRDDPATTARIAETVGWELRRAGITLNLAPDVDINSNPDNPVIGVRSFGTDPNLVARHSAAWVQGLQSTGVAASAKHFPGHGDTALDSHLFLPVVDRSLRELRERELIPFAAVIAAGVQTIMTSHIRLPQLDPDPATFSPRVLGQLLRGDLGFEGVIVSDALDMKGASGDVGIPSAAALALAGGCDLLCIGTANTDRQLELIEEAILAAVADGALDAARVLDAGQRVAVLGAALVSAAVSTPIPDDVTVGEPEFELALAIDAIDIADGVAERLAGAPLCWVDIETIANIAVGIAPWGVFAAGIDADLTLSADAPDPSAVLDLPDGTLPVIVGKGNHRHGWVRAAIDQIRAVRPVVVVDMGWPSDDRRYADIATFGASRYLGTALGSLMLELNGER